MTVENIMVPRSEISAIDINDDWKIILRQLAHCAHTKILLYRDNIDDVVGTCTHGMPWGLVARDQFSKSSPLREVDPIYFIPQGTPSTCSWPSSSATRANWPYRRRNGDIQGLITLDDILERDCRWLTTSMTPTPSDGSIPSRTAPFLVERLRQHPLNKEMDWHLPQPTDPQWRHPGVLEDPQPNISVGLAGPIEILEVENNMVKMAAIMPHLYRDDSVRGLKKRCRWHNAVQISTF